MSDARWDNPREYGERDRDDERVLTRTMQRASTALDGRSGRIRNRLRSVTRRVLIIGYQAR